MNIRYIMIRCLVNAFERMESKFCPILIKYRGKVKVERVITLQMAQQLKTKNINVVHGQLFCRQCKSSIFVRDRLDALMIKINFSLLHILTINSLNAKYQGKSSNQLAFYLSAYMHL